MLNSYEKFTVLQGQNPRMPYQNRITRLLMLLLISIAFSDQLHAQSEPPATQGPSCPSLLNHTFPRLQDEKPVSLCDFSNKVILVVNTASYCGYTNQYDELEKLQQKYAGKEFTVLGFPSNDFGGQEPKSNKEIAEFCANTFGVKFPMFTKTSVRGPAANAFYKKLAAATSSEPGWNFHKYLIGRNGEVLGAYKSSVSPKDSTLNNAIARALATP